MIHYTKVETKDNGFLVFKVIGAQSQENADQIVNENMGESILRGRTLQGATTVCPLFCTREIPQKEAVMPDTNLVIQFIDTQQQLFNTSFDLISAFQDNRNKLMMSAFENSHFSSDSGKRLSSSWLHFFEKNRGHFRDAVNGNFKQMKTCLNGSKTI